MKKISIILSLLLLASCIWKTDTNIIHESSSWSQMQASQPELFTGAITNNIENQDNQHKAIIVSDDADDFVDNGEIPEAQ